ncbi:hypothetical protein EV421DRAFT_1743723 [Armillaria borealis]|uniref:Uncharacterized protein n=1 Tax=Armillaria borealis TaxID=47425 RepID=A0AA39IUN2_9AGAR|nr:hypothetical protein EV421DRAFT_1743723 [Armillaria borealis]
MEHNAGHLPFPPMLGGSLPGTDSVETFNFDNLSDDSSWPSMPTPTLHSSAPTPKSNRHQRRRARRAVTKMPNIPDLQPFDQVHEDRVHCIFCSAQQITTSFGRSMTSTSNWCRHLYTKHLSLWVAVCDKLKIKITSEKAETVVAAYRDPQGQSHNAQRVAGEP